MKLRLNEKDIQKTVMAFLDTLRDGYFWENFSTGIPDKDKETGRRFTRNLPARSRKVPDILGILKGRGCAIEMKSPDEYKFLIKHYDRLKIGPLKTKRDKHLAGQIDFIETYRAKGGLAGFACSLEQVKDILGVDRVVRFDQTN